MNRLDLCPLQESYAVQFGCSVQRSELTGGFSRYTTVTPSKKHLVSISYNLTEPDYHYFRAFYLNWQLNPLPFLMKLYIEDSEFKDYSCQFVPDSFSLDALSGKIFSVSAELVVVISPVVILTSKTYPLYLLESVETDYALTNVVQREVMNTTGLTEKVETQFAITGAMQREANSSMTVNVEKVTTQFAMTAAATRDASVSLNAGGTEKVQTAFALTTATKRTALISNVMQSEKVSTQFAMIAAQITN
jgi:hypothetical protein